MPRVAHGQPRVDAPQGGLGPACAGIRALVHSRSFPTALLSPHRARTHVRMLGTQTSSPSPMPHTHQVTLWALSTCPTRPDSSCADLLGGGQNHRPSHSHTKPLIFCSE